MEGRPPTRRYRREHNRGLSSRYRRLRQCFGMTPEPRASRRYGDETPNETAGLHVSVSVSNSNGRGVDSRTDEPRLQRPRDLIDGNAGIRVDTGQIDAGGINSVVRRHSDSAESALLASRDDSAWTVA
jgi:hypothetical protein